MLDVLLDGLLDSLKLIPFLFITYVVMGIIEAASSAKMRDKILNVGKTGPLWGALIGVIPQCGFSAMGANFYAFRLITLGTLISIFFSTSDEMLPILISEAVNPLLIIKILAIKVVIAVITGFTIDIVLRLFAKAKAQDEEDEEFEFELSAGCNCGGGLWINALAKTIRVLFYIFIFTEALGIAVYLIGPDNFEAVMNAVPVLGPVVAAFIGLIPNCAASVAITQFYLEGAISAGSMISGLLVSAGVGILVLLRENKSKRENLYIIVLMLVLASLAGIGIDAFGIL
ncbi:MAG: arsenic efflux protein [Clostridia bacterium]|nr:arsenic efflux protein [Clostridia bacterium]